MKKLFETVKGLLLEQDSKLMILRKAISDRIPVTINYKGPAGEVLSGQRADIEPVVLGKNAKSGNLVIWAYVFKGTSKTGLPGWKMFRVDRIDSVKFNVGVKPFKLTDLPNYQKGKAPNAMKSLSSVDVFSPYWFEDDVRYKTNTPTQPAPPKPKQQVAPKQKEVPAPTQEPQPQKEPIAIEKPEMSTQDFAGETFNQMQSKVRDVNGEKTISQKDYEDALSDLYNKKEGEWKNYQRMVSGNERPGEGTRARFNNTAKEELDNILSKNNIQVVSGNPPENLSEIFNRFKSLINSKL